MMVASHKKSERLFLLKKNRCPVNGENTYSVFKKGILVFMMDGDRASVFKPEEVEVILASEVRVYRVGNYVFTGSLELNREIERLIPKGSIVCPAVDKIVEL